MHPRFGIRRVEAVRRRSVAGGIDSVNFVFKLLELILNQEVRMVDALQLIGAILLIGAAIWAGDLIAGSIESTLGEKPIRNRANPND